MRLHAEVATTQSHTYKLSATSVMMLCIKHMSTNLVGGMDGWMDRWANGQMHRHMDGKRIFMAG